MPAPVGLGKSDCRSQLGRCPKRWSSSYIAVQYSEAMKLVVSGIQTQYGGCKDRKQEEKSTVAVLSMGKERRASGGRDEREQRRDRRVVRVI